MAVEIPLNPLLSIQKSSDSGLQVALHPLVLLTISDYITRHTLRQQTGPIVGALLGQQNGREITIEHAFDCLLVEVEGEIILNQAWFEERLQQMKDVHKVPALDLVGWYTILPTSGPQSVHLPLHRQILHSYNESAILLGFHPTAVLERQAGGKLPLTIYESNYEAEEAATDAGEDKEMKDDEPQLGLKFRELPYSVETGEAEMISVDFVARGGGNATAVDGTSKKATSQASTTVDVNGKGKTRASKKSDSEGAETAAEAAKQNILTREDEELIASLTAKANAIKMLQSRINLIAVYLQNLPPSFVSDAVPESVESDNKESTPVNHPILRSIQALLTRLSLLVPADSARFEHELLSEQNDVNLVSLLSTITNSIKVVRETGKKSLVVETQKNMKNKSVDRSMWDPSGNGVMGVGDLLG
ncbi:COP9 signalosome complex subunit [Lachnellula hyalina]|uniref:COP9 signalosome complex subunit 6 n=1 Tax=Lachnellula hyalina TaxID=1316788 RepID=A0A8H8TZT1_9HELO|nr:COP9 signalosome complex subunit [Lachnellula hyalina]TVY26197.1 COP9 signalosome complex subunit [Lachnellula hyalina]